MAHDKETYFSRALAAMGAAQAQQQNARALAITGAVAQVSDHRWAAKERMQIRLRHALFRAALSNILTALAGEIPYLVLKGEPLTKMLYGDSSYRSSTDIDLFVLPGDYEEVRRRLLAIGFVPSHEEGPRKWAYNQEALRHSVHGVIVEIHWQIAFPALPAISPLKIFQTRQPFELANNLTVDILRGDWMGLHLALHFHQHTGFAKGLLDIAAWCDRVAPELDRDTFLKKARELGIAGVVQWPLHTLRYLCGECPPMWEEDVDSTVRLWAEISAWALRGSLSRGFTGGVRDSLAALNPTVAPTMSVPIRALTMLTVDGRLEKLRAASRPILQGPHFVGRAVQRMGLIR